MTEPGRCHPSDQTPFPIPLQFSEEAAFNAELHAPTVAVLKTFDTRLVHFRSLCCGEARLTPNRY